MRRKREREGGSNVGFLHLYNRPFQCHCQLEGAPNPLLSLLPCPIHTCQFPSCPPLPSRLRLPLPKGDQLTATSWRGSEASWPRPRAALASGLGRMRRDTMIHSRGALRGHTGHVTNTYKTKGRFSLIFRRVIKQTSCLLVFFYFSLKVEPSCFLKRHPF